MAAAGCASSDTPKSLAPSSNWAWQNRGSACTWAYNRIEREDDRWPRRLVWCLPMRVLVEQTWEVARAICAKMPSDSKPGVTVLMGGEDTEEWYLESILRAADVEASRLTTGDPVFVVELQLQKDG